MTGKNQISCHAQLVNVKSEQLTPGRSNLLVTVDQPNELLLLPQHGEVRDVGRGAEGKGCDKAAAVPLRKRDKLTDKTRHTNNTHDKMQITS